MLFDSFPIYMKDLIAYIKAKLACLFIDYTFFITTNKKWDDFTNTTQTVLKNTMEYLLYYLSSPKDSWRLLRYSE